MIALLGGTFDPIHEGHVSLAKAIVSQFKADRLLLIPAAQNPLKKNSPVASDSERCKMIEAALKEAGDKRLELCTIEIERQGKSYTVDTLETLKKSVSSKKLTLVIGDEVFTQFAEWHRPRDILKCANLIIVTRTQKRPDVEEVLRKIGVTPRQLSPNKWSVIETFSEIEIFPFEALPFSSTSIRENLRRLWENWDHEKSHTMMPRGIQRSVWEVIKVSKLYAVRQ